MTASAVVLKQVDFRAELIFVGRLVQHPVDAEFQVVKSALNRVFRRATMLRPSCRRMRMVAVPGMEPVCQRLTRWPSARTRFIQPKE